MVASVNYWHNSIFATMWADQVSVDDEVVDWSSVQKEIITGYVMDNKVEETMPQASLEEPSASEVISPEPQNPFVDPIM